MIWPNFSIEGVFFILKAEVWLILYLTRGWIFGFRFLTIAWATISDEIKTNSWHINDIIEQDLTLVIRVIYLCFYLANPFRLVVTRFNSKSDLGGCDTWNYRCRKKWTANNNLYILTISEVSEFLRRQFSRLATSSTTVYRVILGMGDSSCEAKEWNWKYIQRRLVIWC